jgi:hypothetical protein
MTAQEIRASSVRIAKLVTDPGIRHDERVGLNSMQFLAEIAAQLAELNEKFSDV